MVKERRKSPRARVNLPARWEGALHQETGTITDLSKIGCFILSGGSVQVKELIWVEIQLPQDPPVRFWCEVVDAAYEIGFAVKFNAGRAEDETRLNKFIESLFVSDARKQ